MNPPAHSVLENLEIARKDLLDLSGDICAKLAQFETLTSEISELVQRFTEANLQAEEQSGAENDAENVRMVKQPRCEEPHSIDKDFKRTRPCGYILDGQTERSIKTWQDLYCLICRQLYARDAERFLGLREDSRFISKQGRHSFDCTPSNMTKHIYIAENLYADSCFDANHICDVVRRLLVAFNIPKEKLQIFLHYPKS